MIIRNEVKADYRKVEELTRNAFWNFHTPGCNEHFLVHKMRSHKDFINELNFVLLIDNEIIGNIMYTKAKLINENKEELEIVTFGPVSIDPNSQRKGYGKHLIEHSITKAKELGYDFIVIFGNPSNYVGLNFQSCKRYNIHCGNDVFPSAMLVNKIGKDILEGKKWQYIESSAYKINDEETEEFDKKFKPRIKETNKRQEEFYILSNSRIQK